MKFHFIEKDRNLLTNAKYKLNKLKNQTTQHLRHKSVENHCYKIRLFSPHLFQEHQSNHSFDQINLISRMMLKLISNFHFSPLKHKRHFDQYLQIILHNHLKISTPQA